MANGNGHAATAAPVDKQRRKKIPHDEAERPTDEEMEIRIQFCRDRLAMGMRVWKVREEFCERFKVVGRTAERYLSRARNLIAEELKTPLVELRNESLAFYRTLSLDSEAKKSDRLAARKALDELMGTRAPREHWHAGAKGGAIVTQETGKVPQLIVNIVAVTPKPAELPELPAIPAKTGE